MFKGTSPKGLFGYDPKCKVFRVVCIEECKQDEEVHIQIHTTVQMILQQFTICYGDKSNADLVVEYGFVLKDNSYDNVQLSLPPSLNHSLDFKEREALLYQKGITRRSESYHWVSSPSQEHFQWKMRRFQLIYWWLLECITWPLKSSESLLMHSILIHSPLTMRRKSIRLSFSCVSSIYHVTDSPFRLWI